MNRRVNLKKKDAIGLSAPLITFGELISDNSLIDLVYSEAAGLKLISSDAVRFSISPQIKIAGKMFVPPVLAEDLLKAMPLPSGPEKYGSTEKLFNDLCEFLSIHPGLSKPCVLAIAYHCFATWFADCLPMVPSLSLVAPETSGRDLLFRVLRHICRRTLHLLEPTRADVLDLPLSLRPTLIIDEARPSQSLQQLLRVMTQPAGVVWRSGHPKKICCATITCSAEPLSDRLLLNRTVQIILSPNRVNPSKVNQMFDSALAQSLSARLFDYRLRNFAKVRASKFEVSGPLCDLAVALGSCIVGDDKLQAEVISLLEPQVEDLRARNSTWTVSVVIEAALAFCHDPKRKSAYVGAVADAANGILRGRGESIQLEARAVGDVLSSSLRLFIRRLGSAGRGIDLLSETRRAIHRLAVDYDVRSLESKIEGCDLCRELRS